MSDPTGPVPAADQPDGDPEPATTGRDWRVITIASLLGVIAVLVVVLALVRTGGDDGGDDVATDASTTTATSSTTTSTSSTSTTTVSTTTTNPPASTAPTTTAPTTTTTTTTTTTAPPTTIEPVRCTDADAPEELAEVLYDSWTVRDERCAREVATSEAVEDLFGFTFDPDKPWALDGCEPRSGTGNRTTDCTFRYPGGSATFEVDQPPVGEPEIVAVAFRADDGA